MRLKILVYGYNKSNSTVFVSIKERNSLKLFCRGRYNFEKDVFTINNNNKKLLDIYNLNLLIETLLEKDWGRDAICYPKCPNKNKFRLLINSIFKKYNFK